MNIKSTLKFNREERRVLETAALSVPIAFGERPEDGSKSSAWRAYEGRHLLTIANPDYHSPEQLAGALVAAEKLYAVLEEQSDRAYWEQELTPPPTEDPQNVLEVAVKTGVSLIAPGTDVAGMLAETRARQREEVERALPLLYEAARRIPVIEEEED